MDTHTAPLEAPPLPSCKSNLPLSHRAHFLIEWEVWDAQQDTTETRHMYVCGDHLALTILQVSDTDDDTVVCVVAV